MGFSEIIIGFQQAGIEINAGASIEQLNKLEARTGFKFPDVFKQFYCTANGFKNYDMTPGLFSLFSIELINEYGLCYHEDFIGFSD
ncbi:SMI1/KNR4 family protein [Hymenobacter negativus]|uniref:SMI1/KNR4 family protein n=1 Tax=Hymenobacter negativus TaxID=2795026 RepID=A0ABS0Q3I3_9BACT|nr:SMI1/KNR4 family protein [Hymenobacter negativus]MBH8557190.1 SMI1/KNR4 family protein [Hymenobacter negativus]